MNGDSSDMGHIDALSYIDKEYEHEMVQEAVHALISEEMHKFTPSKAQYLAHLPYPKLKFANSPALQVRLHRFASGFMNEYTCISVARLRRLTWRDGYTPYYFEFFADGMASCRKRSTCRKVRYQKIQRGKTRARP
jgi:hypothetical protein